MADDILHDDDPAESTDSQSSPPVDLKNAGADEPSLSPPSLASALRHYNFEIDEDTSDDDIVARFEELESTAEEAERLRQENAQYKSWLAQQRQPEPKAEETPAQPSQQPKRDVPEWDPTWEADLKYDDDGRLVPRSVNVNPDVVTKYKKRKLWESEQARLLFENPSEYLKTSGAFDVEALRTELVEQAYKRALDEFDKKQQQAKVTGLIEQYEETHKSWLYDKPGVMSKLGTALNESLTEYLTLGMAPDKALKNAQRDVQDATGQTPWQADAEAAEPVTPAKKKAVLRRQRVNGTNRIAQTPIRRAKAGEEIIEQPTARHIRDSWASQLKQAAGLDS